MNRDENGCYVKGHSDNLGKKINQPFGSANGHWKGDNASYRAFHYRVRNERGIPTQCENCDKPKGRLEWHNVSGNYADPFDYVSLCSSCHKHADMTEEGRSNMSESAKKRDAAGKRQRDERGRYA